MPKKSDFKKDLERGNYYEKKALNILKKHNFKDLTIIQGFNPYYDIQGIYKKKKAYIEVKYNKYTSYTNKIFIEVSKPNGTPAGLSITKSTYYILFSYYKYWIIKTNKLKKALEEFIRFELEKEGIKKASNEQLFNYIEKEGIFTNNSIGVLIPTSNILCHSIFYGEHKEQYYKYIL